MIRFLLGLCERAEFRDAVEFEGAGDGDGLFVEAGDGLRIGARDNRATPAGRLDTRGRSGGKREGQRAQNVVTLDARACGLEPGVLVVMVGVILVHEGIHGLFFWLFTHRRPTFGFKGYYAYASAPGWYIPRNPYLVVSLAPFVLMTLAGVWLMAVVSGGWIPPLLLLISMNAAGAVGDLMVAAWIIGKPAWFLIQDFGDGVILYGPEDVDG